MSGEVSFDDFKDGNNEPKMLTSTVKPQEKQDQGKLTCNFNKNMAPISIRKVAILRFLALKQFVILKARLSYVYTLRFIVYDSFSGVCH
jgi:hypothetical protein